MHKQLDKRHSSATAGAYDFLGVQSPKVVMNQNQLEVKRESKSVLDGLPESEHRAAKLDSFRAHLYYDSEKGRVAQQSQQVTTANQQQIQSYIADLKLLAANKQKAKKRDQRANKNQNQRPSSSNQRSTLAQTQKKFKNQVASKNSYRDQNPSERISININPHIQVHNYHNQQQNSSFQCENTAHEKESGAKLTRLFNKLLKQSQRSFDGKQSDSNQILNRAAIPKSNASLKSSKPYQGPSRSNLSQARSQGSKQRRMSARINSAQSDDISRKVSPKRKASGSQKAQRRASKAKLERDQLLTGKSRQQRQDRAAMSNTQRLPNSQNSKYGSGAGMQKAAKIDAQPKAGSNCSDSKIKKSLLQIVTPHGETEAKSQMDKLIQSRIQEKDAKLTDYKVQEAGRKQSYSSKNHKVLLSFGSQASSNSRSRSRKRGKDRSTSNDSKQSRDQIIEQNFQFKSRKSAQDGNRGSVVSNSNILGLSTFASSNKQPVPKKKQLLIQTIQKFLTQSQENRSQSANANQSQKFPQYSLSMKNQRDLETRLSQQYQTQQAIDEKLRLVNESILKVRQSPQQSNYSLDKAISFIMKKPFKRAKQPEEFKRSQTQLLRNGNQVTKLLQDYKKSKVNDILHLQKALMQKNPKQSQPTLTQRGDGYTNGAVSSIMASQYSAKNNSALDYATDPLQEDMRWAKRPLKVGGLGPGLLVNPARSKTRQHNYKFSSYCASNSSSVGSRSRSSQHKQQARTRPYKESQAMIDFFEPLSIDIRNTSRNQMLGHLKSRKSSDSGAKKVHARPKSNLSENRSAKPSTTKQHQPVKVERQNSTIKQKTQPKQTKVEDQLPESLEDAHVQLVKRLQCLKNIARKVEIENLLESLEMKHDLDSQRKGPGTGHSISNDLLKEDSDQDEMLRWKLAESDIPAPPKYRQSNDMSRLVAEQSESKSVSQHHRFMSSQSSPTTPGKCKARLGYFSSDKNSNTQLEMTSELLICEDIVQTPQEQDLGEFVKKQQRRLAASAKPDKEQIEVQPRKQARDTQSLE